MANVCMVCKRLRLYSLSMISLCGNANIQEALVIWVVGAVRGVGTVPDSDRLLPAVGRVRSGGALSELGEEEACFD